MTKKLTWKEIEKLFDKEWVELVDYDWPDEEPDPLSGVVRVHAKSRKEFDKLVSQEPPADSAFAFVGKPDIAKNKILSTFNTITIRNLG